MPEQSFSITASVAKLDDEKQLVTGWAVISNDASGRPVIDAQGDLIPLAELEKAAHELVLTGGADKTDDMHERFKVGDVVEAMVVTKAKREALGMGPGPEGLVVTMKVRDAKTWADVKAGKKLELSIFGTGQRSPLA